MSVELFEMEDDAVDEVEEVVEVEEEEDDESVSLLSPLFFSFSSSSSAFILILSGKITFNKAQTTEVTNSHSVSLQANPSCKSWTPNLGVN